MLKDIQLPSAQTAFPLGECLGATTTELVLELLDAASRIDEALFARVHRMGIHRDIADDFYVLNAIDGFRLSRLNSRER